MVLADNRIRIVFEIVVMKKFLILIPLILTSCNKKELLTEDATVIDTIQLFNQNSLKTAEDSSENGIVAIPQMIKDSSQAFRVIEGHKIIKTINGDMLPLSIYDEFTKEHQQLIIKIKNFKNPNIKATINSESSNMNIRFNQIKMASGEYDGPFGKTMSAKTNVEGEIWLIIGKSIMASGETTGKFSVWLQ